VVSGPRPRRKPISTATSRHVCAAAVMMSAIGLMSNWLLSRARSARVARIWCYVTFAVRVC